MVTSSTRVTELPGVPTAREAGLSGLTAEVWQMVLAPAGTPPAILDRLNAEIAAQLARPDLRDSLKQAGFEVFAGNRQATEAFVDRETQSWKKLATDIDLKLD